MQYAGFWKRFVAMTLDFLILIIPMALVSYALPFVGAPILAILYFPIFEASRLQTTPGKYWMGLRVAQEDGQPVDFLRAFGRFFLKYVSSMLMFVGYLIQPFTARRQTLHDLLVGCVVIESTQVVSVDWLSAWMQSMRFLLRVDQNPQTVDAVFTKSETGDSSVIRKQSLDSIEKLHDLYKSGALTEDEYQNKKSEILAQV